MFNLFKWGMQKIILPMKKIEKLKLQKKLLIVMGCFILGTLIFNYTLVSAKESNPYYIKINKQQNCITIYEKDDDGKYTVPVKAMTCSTGSQTPIGTFDTKIKYRWKLLMGDVWGQYSTRITGGVLFHSVWYYAKDPSTLSWKQFNKLGTSASHGCVRITVQDAKWIYDNCPVGTTVQIYNSKNPGPLGKPETIKLSAGTGWDPTDLNEKNPFLNKKPSIKGAKNISITWGVESDLLKGIKATSTTGTDITSKLTVLGNVNFYKAGEYEIKYEVTDAIGRSATKKVMVTVKHSDKEPVFKGVRTRYAADATVINKEFALDGVDAYASSKKLSKDNIKVTIVKVNEDSYTIKYSISISKKIYTTATAKVIIDRNAPIFEGIGHREITLEEYNTGVKGIEEIALDNIDVSDDYSDLTIDDVIVTVNAISDYGYLVTYQVKDEAGNTTEETVQFTYYKDARIDGVVNQYNISPDVEITDQYVKQGITASLGQEDITDQLSVSITNDNDNKYKVTYTVNNSDDTAISVVAYYYKIETTELTEDSDGE